MSMINWKTVIGATLFLLAGILALEVKDVSKIHPSGSSALLLPVLGLGFTIITATVLIIIGLREKSTH